MSWLTDLFKSDAAKKAKAALQTEIDAYKPRVLTAIDEAVTKAVGEAGSYNGALYLLLQNQINNAMSKAGVPGFVVSFVSPFISSLVVSRTGVVADNIRREADRLKKQIQGARL